MAAFTTTNNHNKEVLKVSKPAKNKLTAQEKKYLMYILNTWLNGISEEEEQLTLNLIKKLK